MSFIRNYSNKTESSGNKDMNKKKMVYKGVNQDLEMNKSKREVYPQFSEPDEYISATYPGNSTFKSDCQLSEKFVKFEQNMVSGRSASGSNRKENITPSNLYLPSFQEYVKVKMEESFDRPGNDTKQNKTNSFLKENVTSSFRKVPYKANGSFSYSEGKNEEATDNKKKIQKELIGTRTRHLIGTIDQVIRWNKMVKNAEIDVHYEVAGILESKINKDGKSLIFMRSESGHKLQGVFYTIDRELPDFRPGSTIAAIGNMIGSNKLQIFDAMEIKPEDFISIQRLGFLSQRSLHEAFNG